MDPESPAEKERKTFKKSPCKVQQGAVFSGKILSFGCSVCKDDFTYSPNDLLKHFQGAHKGTLPTYPCDLCGFVTNEFPALQRHRIGHRSTPVTCEKEEIKDFVYKHFKEVTDHSNGSFICDPEECSMDPGSPTEKERKTFKKSPCKVQQGAVFSGKILSFGCSVCKDDFTYSPNDLLKHFRGAHKGTLPTYPCDLCGFVTNEFPALQRHRIGHRNTLVTCEICNDGVQYSLLLLTRHYIMCHSQNGHFRCEKCDFTTVDAGTFVQHIHHHNERCFKCVKCRHVSLNQEEYQKHMKAHSGTFPFTCQICGYGAARSEYLTKHMLSVHNEERKSVWRAIEDNSSPTHSSAGLKLLLKKGPSNGGESKESHWMSKLTCLPGSLSNKNGRLLKQERSLEEAEQFVDRTVVKKDNKNWSKSSHNKEQPVSLAFPSAPLMSQERDNSSGSDAASHTSPNGLTVLMVKNKISLPPNCTTKVMGFKMVDGKKHLVLKVIPTAKQESSTQNPSAIEDLGSRASDCTYDESKETVENGEHHDINCLTSPCLNVSQSGFCMQTDQDDIVAVKVKQEEEENSVSSLFPSLHKDEVEEQTQHSKKWCSTDTVYPMAQEPDHVKELRQLDLSTCLEKSHLDINSLSATFNTDPPGLCDYRVSNIGSPVLSTDMVTGQSLPSNLAQQMLHKVLPKENAENFRAPKVLATADAVDDTLTDKSKGDCSYNTMSNGDQFSQNAPEITESQVKFCKNAQQNTSKLSTFPVPQPESPSSTSSIHRETAIYTENYTQNSPNQEVFSFHNYSKETFSISLHTTQPFDNLSDNSTDRESVCDEESSQFSLTLAESPPLLTEGGNGSVTIREEDNQYIHGKDMEKVSDSDIEVDECIASVEDSPTEDENPESILEDFNIIKIEEENIPVSKKQPESRSCSASLGRIVEEHSDAIITQQLNKERNGTSSASSDCARPTKTTLRILQMPEGKQQMLLQTSENRYAMPVQLKGNPGFKLITNSINPQINVSYMKPGLQRSHNLTGLTLTANGGRTRVSTPVPGACEKGATLLSPIQPVSTTSNHYLINSTGFKGPVLLSSTGHCTAMDKTVKTQPTCYLVQRSLPVVQAPSNPGYRLATSQVPLSSRPVLAMPVSSANKSTTLQTSRQAFLVRYISPPKSGILLNNSEGKTMTQCSQTRESTGNKVVFKIVTPTSGLLTSGATTAASQPLFLATRPQTQCFLVSSNRTNANASTEVKKLIPIQSTAQKHVKLSCLLPSQPTVNVKVKSHEEEKLVLAPRPIRPPSQRKRRRKPLFDELSVSVHKARRLTNKTLTEKETTAFWQPIPKEVERTLRLSPFSSFQQVKCPRRYQPVVVLNHPDADIPEVASIMKSVNRYRGAVTKVSLSQKTVQALSELEVLGRKSLTKGPSSQSNDPIPRPVQSSVRERFILKMKLRKKSKKKYEVVKALSNCTEKPSVFDCWFCGRLFSSQEDWIGHGQRHLMEATRDWNKLF
uniref:Si:ch211-214e3.5 n=2 Tax=Myripristis murdjan TaxID=586833 RepID=A0A667YSD2_9TELE